MSVHWQQASSYEHKTVEEIFKIKSENLTLQDTIDKITMIAIRLARQLDANNPSMKENMKRNSPSEEIN
jgi:hypothetical protein